MTMTWAYRVVRRRFSDDGDDGDDGLLGIHEAYAAPAVPPHAISANPVAALGVDVDELRTVLQQMLAALDQPVLDYEDF